MDKKYDLPLTEGKKCKIIIERGDIEIITENAEKAYLMISEVMKGVPGKQNESAEDPVTIEEKEEVKINIKTEGGFLSWKRLSFHMPTKWENNLEVEIQDGGLRIYNLKGKITSNCKNGRIICKNIKGTLAANCENGRIVVSNCNGKIKLNNTKGAIIIKGSEISGGSIKSQNGKVSVQIKPLAKGKLDISSSLGQIKLALPEEGNYKVKVNKKCEFNNDLKKAMLQEETDFRVLQVGNGEFTINLENEMGGVKLLKYEDFEQESVHPFFRAEDFLGKLTELDFPQAIQKVIENFGSFWSNLFGETSETSNESSTTSKKTEQGDYSSHINKIIDLLNQGKINAEEAEKLIRALKGK